LAGDAFPPASKKSLLLIEVGKGKVKSKKKKKTWRRKLFSNQSMPSTEARLRESGRRVGKPRCGQASHTAGEGKGSDFPPKKTVLLTKKEAGRRIQGGREGRAEERRILSDF